MTTASRAPQKIDVGTVLQTVADTYGKTLSVLLPAALILFAPVALIAALFADTAVGGLVAGLCVLIVSAWYSGMVVRTVEDVQDGQVDASMGQLLRSVGTAIWPLLGVAALVTVNVLAGIVLFVVPGLILLTFLAVAGPVVVIERPGVFAALGRSESLVRGNGWQVFGVMAAILALMVVLSIVIGTVGAIGDSFVLYFLVELLLNVALAPVYALSAAVLYFSLRDAHEPAPSTPGVPPSNSP